MAIASLRCSHAVLACGQPFAIVQSDVEVESTPTTTTPLEVSNERATPEPTAIIAPTTGPQETETATSIPPTQTAHAEIISDYVLCEGASANTPRDAGPNVLGPWNARLLTATSSDGLNWTRTYRVVADQADVPAAIVAADDRIFLYFVTWCDDVHNRVVVAISDDTQNWAYKLVNIEGIPPGSSAPVDPAVVQIDDGRWRMYFTLGAPGGGIGQHLFGYLH